MRLRGTGVWVTGVALASLAACTSHAKLVSRPPVTSPPASSPAGSGSYAGWRTYHSRWEGMTFRYPADWRAIAQPPMGDPHKGDAVLLRAPDGFSVHWYAPLDGIGGGCDPKRNPHIVVDRIIRMPQIGSRNPLSVAVVSIERHKSLVVVDRFSFDDGRLEPGDTGQCLFYPTFRSRGHADVSFLQFTTSGVQIGNGVESSDGSERITDARYLDRPDIKTTLMIFRSLRYR